MKYSCVIFDLDGTILNTERMNIIPLQKLLLEDQGKEIAYEELVKYMAYPGRKTIELLEFEDVDLAYKKWVDFIHRSGEKASLFEDFDKILHIINSKGVLCGIASSKTKHQYEIDFISTGLHGYMKSVVLAEDTDNHKPHPDPLIKAIEFLNINPREAIYVGDTVADSQAARAAGMDFALASWGARDLTIPADYILQTPHDLLAVLGIH
ncbi:MULTISPECIES: HAD family hydrolase [Bacillus]|uniref:HAD family hydrolase n=1 Tax=Bacillus TaxID=1386 RepID=UPI0002E010E4|nr:MULTISPECIES: HAD family hydrolase [Bacillus]